MQAFILIKNKIFAVLAIIIVFISLSSYTTAGNGGWFNLGVPFVSRAPFGNWAYPYQGYCEEASVVMAAHYIWKLPLTPEIADTEMGIIKSYEELVLGGRYDDTNMEETANILKSLYGFSNIQVKPTSSAEDIKKELMDGNLVIVPVAGRLLNNPYYVFPGPLYHVVLVRGFYDNKKVFITNDPGTRRGNGLWYDQGVLFNAIHDWNNGNVLAGKKVMIVIGVN